MTFKASNTIFTIGNGRDYRVSHLDEFPEVLPVLNTKFIVFTHTKAAGAALRMHKAESETAWKLRLYGWVAERS